MRIYIRFLAIALTLCLILCSCRRLESEEPPEESTAPEPVVVYPKADGKRVVILDAGHGFRDIGCDTDLMEGTEADVTAAVVHLLKEELEKQEITVILTHDGESFPDGESIKTLANKAGIEYEAEDIIDNDIFSAYERAIYSASLAADGSADLFLSLHVNSIENNPDVSQYEMYYYAENPHATAIEVLCEELGEKLDNKWKSVSGGYEDSYLVTKIGDHPSLLFEMGYATNKTDAEKLNSAEWRRTLASTIADSISDWISSYEE